MTEERFIQQLEAASFQWPLKPFGVDKNKSLAKTASTNKSAETKVYMGLLGERHLFNPRDPTGPLPTSLRPKLNAMLQQDGVDERTAKRVFEALVETKGGGGRGSIATLSVEALKQQLEIQPLDYYSFLDLLGTPSIVWPSGK